MGPISAKWGTIGCSDDAGERKRTNQIASLALSFKQRVVGSSPTGLPSIPREAGETVARHTRARKKAIGKPERKEAEKKQKRT